VMSVHLATTVSRAVCHVTVMCPAVGLTNVMLVTVSVMMVDSVLARYSFYFSSCCLHRLLELLFFFGTRNGSPTATDVVVVVVGVLVVIRFSK